MWTATDEVAWDRRVAQARVEVQAWRAAHPQATLRQIEQEIDARLAPARARLVEAIALASPVETTPATCPACRVMMAWEGTRQRRLTTTHNEPLALTRRYARCPRCGTGLFPPG